MNKKLLQIPVLASLLFSACSDDKDEPSPMADKTNPSAYAAKVFHYEYGVGQHLELLKKCPPDSIVGNGKHQVLLGGWGGHIIVGFDHDIKNQEGEDLIILCGNSVSPEPGIIYVMEDTNHNGMPDDTWHEIKGSETGKPGYIANYRLTYFKPKENGSNVTWSDNQGGSGELPESAKWWPNANADSLSYEGARLPDAYINTPQANGQQYWKVRQELFRYGYAENGPAPDRTKENGFLATDFDTELKGNRIEIDSATNADGGFAELNSVRFVKVQTGVFQQAGWLGEISTEINGVADLHELGTPTK